MVQLAVTNIADDDTPLLALAAFHAAENRRAGDREFAWRGETSDGEVAGLDGSSLVTVIIALAGPSAAGAKRIGTLIALSASNVSGKL